MNNYGVNLSKKQLKIGYFFVAVVFLVMYQAGFFENKDIIHYTLYKKENVSKNEKNHIATFNAFSEDKIVNQDLNLKNCQFLAKLFNDYEKGGVEYWCEKGSGKYFR